MGYESLSTIIVLVIVAIILIAWLPRRTVNSMKRVVEHREDKYSASLHLVDADSGTRFSDDHATLTKGAIMQPQPARGGVNREHIARVRQLRREAMRRRQIIAASLLALAIVVLVLALFLHFSPLFALIPTALLAGVLALGVNAAKQARAWEHKVALAERKERRERKASYAAAIENATAPAAGASSDADTDVMEQREIRRALRRAEQDKAEALARREERSAEAIDTSATSVSEDPQTAIEAAPASESAPEVRDEAKPAELRDATAELSEIHPAPALDAFEMAASQDLISFSLGAPRSGFDVPTAEPESLEIKSTKQVAKAVPVDAEQQTETVEAATDADADADAESAAAEPAAEVASEVSEAATSAPHEPVAAHNPSDEFVDTAAFHLTETTAEVEVPVATSDSLGAGLESILARRGAPVA